ncbi:hypothetical protein MKEN_01141700 [Mycena kentingensis (nom. inval.)]|nr:hypothetical protein MKEN_01141700 [Mycena kentingensis (nom. inval.)]
MPVLPVELVQLILSFIPPRCLEPNNSQNYLSQPVASTVAACGLVCRSWLSASRRILFHRTRIPLKKAHLFEKLISPPGKLRQNNNDETPLATFLPYIRELHIGPGLGENRWMLSVFRDRISPLLQHGLVTMILEASHWAEQDKIIPLPPVTQFTRLTRFELRGAWPVRLQEVLCCISGLPVLEELIIASFRCFQDAPSSARKRRGSSLIDAKTPPAPPTTLRKLGLIYMTSYPIFRWIFNSGVRLQLEVLQFTFPGTIRNATSLAIAYARDALALVARHQATLQSLGLRFRSSANFGYDELEDWDAIRTDAGYDRIFAEPNPCTKFLHAHRKLRRLHLEAKAPILIRFLRQALEGANCLPGLRELILSMPTLYDPECALIDSLLCSQPEKLQGLEHVVLEPEHCSDLDASRLKLPLSIARGEYFLEARVPRQDSELF